MSQAAPHRTGAVVLSESTYQDKEAMRKLKPVRDDKGVLPGLFKCDICRIEMRDDGWWRAQVPMRDIGNSQYREFCPIERGGAWMDFGSYKVKAGALAAAERLQSGVYVWLRPYKDEFGLVPGRLVEFKDAVEAIRAAQ